MTPAERAAVERHIAERRLMPGGRYLYAAGRSLHQTQNCALYRAEDTREGWADLLHKATMSLMTGAGIGVDYGRVRPSGTPIHRTGGLASGPISLMQILNEAGRHIMQGGGRRSAIWAGLPWDHDDAEEFIRIKDWDEETVARKAEDFNFQAPLDMTNISIQLDDAFFEAYDRGDPKAVNIYRLTCESMFRTAEPGFSIDVGKHSGETLRNACTEVTSFDDSDICNLGSINMAKMESVVETEDAAQLGTLFLLAGTVYSHLPHKEIEVVREKNRRLGLGQMGIHDWLLQHGKKYGPDPELEQHLLVYEQASDFWAEHYADHYGLSRPVARRAIAPTGTIAIVAETTWAMEPILAKAYIRRYKEARPGHPDITRSQYVVDPTARRLIASGVSPDDIDDAYTIDFEQRIKTQAWIQQFVDQGVSSTINMPEPIFDQAEAARLGDILYPYLPKLRGVTCYPNGARGGQPVTPVDYEEAIHHEGVVFTEQEDRCRGGVCGV